SSSVRPIDWASRRAGSMVSTTVRRPCCSAARSPSAAAVVVLPTPPEPQHTMILVAGFASNASTSRRGAAVTSRAYPEPGRSNTGEDLGQLIQAGPVHTGVQERQLDQRPAHLGQI